ncbi:MAG: translation initiation factor IF-3 [Planctomycetes bacterium]|jgi:translation initiation factor IF-3|nr:translation initiation factor IF-3 [Planctomycetota bacterium]MCC7064603.1 translation initiation factor IF-3 [Planctomycetota bacterium]
MSGRPDSRRPSSQDRGPRINHQIRIRQVRVIDEENKQLGIMETADALALALHKQLDLVEIAPNQRPPVCRIMDFGKFKYEEKKKEQASRRKQHQVQIKELRVRPGTGEHDLQVKMRQARQFLADGDKVLVCCLFRGRQMAHKEVGEQVVKEVVQLLTDVAKVESPLRMEGKRMVLLLSKK